MPYPREEDDYVLCLLNPNLMPWNVEGMYEPGIVEIAEFMKRVVIDGRLPKRLLQTWLNLENPTIKCVIALKMQQKLTST